MIQLNLLPDVKKEFLRAESARRKTIAVSILVTIIAVGLTVVFAIYVYAVQNVIIFAQTQDIKNKAQQLSGVKDIDKYLTIQNQLKELSSLHNDKNNYSRLLAFLPTLNPAPPQNVTLTNLEVVSADTTINLKGTVADYGSLTTFKDTLANADYSYQSSSDGEPVTGKLFKEVVIESASYEKTANKSGVNFSIMLTYEPEVFKQANTNVSVTVPNKETTNSVTNSPQAIFGGQQ